MWGRIRARIARGGVAGEAGRGRCTRSHAPHRVMPAHVAGIHVVPSSTGPKKQLNPAGQPRGQRCGVRGQERRGLLSRHQRPVAVIIIGRPRRIAIVVIDACGATGVGGAEPLVLRNNQLATRPNASMAPVRRWRGLDRRRCCCGVRGLARAHGAADLAGAGAAGDVGKHLADLLDATPTIRFAAKAKIDLPWRTRTRGHFARQRIQHLAVGQLITGTDDHRVL